MKIYSTSSPVMIKNFNDLSILQDFQEGAKFTFTSSRYRYFVAQLALVSPFHEKDLSISVSALIGKSHEIKDAVTVLNAQGKNAKDNLGGKGKITLKPNTIQPLFVGFDLSKANIETYKCIVQIGKKNVELTVKTTDDVVFYEGAEDIHSLSFLKWLDTSLSNDKSLAAGYEPITIQKNLVSFTGKTIWVENSGLIGKVESYFNSENSKVEQEVQNQLFYLPMEFIVEGQKLNFTAKPKITGYDHKCNILATGQSEGLDIEVAADIKYEGRLDYTIKLTATNDVITSNIRLNSYFSACTYSMGLGKAGGELEERDEFKWSAKNNQDSVFIGDINCGARVRFVSNEAREQMQGKHYFSMPLGIPHSSWDNYGKGKISIKKTDKGAQLTAETGERIIPRGIAMEFKFQVHLTPFKNVQYGKHFSSRTLQKMASCMGFEQQLKEAELLALNFINISCTRGEGEEPLDNPFMDNKALINGIIDAHNRDIRVNLVYDIQKLFAHSSFLRYVFLAFGDELMFKIKSDTNEQIEEENYLAVRGSRLEKYYASEVNYLINKYNIDGLFIPHPNLERDTLEGIKKLFDKKERFWGGVEISIQDNLLPQMGGASVLNLNTDILPFVDRVAVEGKWSSYHPDYMLMEMSGIPFGLTSQPLNRWGSPYLGLLFGMNGRYGYGGEKESKIVESIYALWESFGIKDATYKGFWNKENPVTSDKKEVKVSTYINGDNLLAVVYNLSKKTIDFEIGVDIKRGFTSNGKKVFKPLIVGLQAQKRVDITKPFRLKKESGFILLIETKGKQR